MASATFPTPAGKVVVNFEKNMAGYVQFTVDAKAGDEIDIFICFLGK